MLLARFGLLPGTVFHTYTFTVKSKEKSHYSENRFTGGRPGSSGDFDKQEGWYQDVQEGEVITLPETALKKDGE
jgi:hypothetical protein